MDDLKAARGCGEQWAEKMNEHKRKSEGGEEWVDPLTPEERKEYQRLWGKVLADEYSSKHQAERMADEMGYQPQSDNPDLEAYLDTVPFENFKGDKTTRDGSPNVVKINLTEEQAYEMRFMVAADIKDLAKMVPSTNVADEIIGWANVIKDLAK